jgi:hypothetical protein
MGPFSKSHLTVQIFNPPRGFHIGDLPKMPLSGGEVGVAKDDLTYNLDWNT